MKDENDEGEGPGGQRLVEGNPSQDVENQVLAYQNRGGNPNSAHHSERTKSPDGFQSVSERGKVKGVRLRFSEGGMQRED